MLAQFSRFLDILPEFLAARKELLPLLGILLVIMAFFNLSRPQAGRQPPICRYTSTQLTMYSHNSSIISMDGC
jgi:hypothetical protein